MGNKLQIYSDGGARGNPGPAACAAVFLKNNKVIFQEATYLGRQTNNEAEYQGVILALTTLGKNKGWLKDSVVNFYLDSELVTKQLNGAYKIKKTTLATLSIQVKKLERALGAPILYQHIPREKNKIADQLVNIELDKHQ